MEKKITGTVVLCGIVNNPKQGRLAVGAETITNIILRLV